MLCFFNILLPSGGSRIEEEGVGGGRRRNAAIYLAQIAFARSFDGSSCSQHLGFDYVLIEDAQAGPAPAGDFSDLSDLSDLSA